MADERITERDDGVVHERVTERDGPHTTTVIERRGSGMTPVLLLLVLVALAAIAYFLFVGNERESATDGAVTDAATAVEGAAKDVGDAARKAVD
ncbi:hypothetical protein GGR88_001099 [Sphingomonas jejuensis]|jgi:hypothetical protein|uniref:Uncharacterized protein n=1 Tax=Sphingomonas jejuensis TaxID=904715 RepID=A0ABX0XK58_9SPHN|nr:hypothetical protein [Sphingomonas jejuensis]NJC33625.1 hypothetical protein [Sphingomonas jejuensis]